LVNRSRYNRLTGRFVTVFDVESQLYHRSNGRQDTDCLNINIQP